MRFKQALALGLFPAQIRPIDSVRQTWGNSLSSADIFPVLGVARDLRSPVYSFHEKQSGIRPHSNRDLRHDYGDAREPARERRLFDAGDDWTHGTDLRRSHGTASRQKRANRRHPRGRLPFGPDKNWPERYNHGRVD